MALLPWIKLSTATFKDEKIKIIKGDPNGHSYIVIFLELLCLAGEINDKGLVYITKAKPYSVKELAICLNENDNIVSSALDILAQYELIELTKVGFIKIKNWAKYQQKKEGKKSLHGFLKEEGELFSSFEDGNIDPNTIEHDSKTIKEIFDTWNSYSKEKNPQCQAGVIGHRAINNYIPVIKAALKNYHKDEIIQSFANYAKVLCGEEYFWTKEWRLDIFLKQKNAIDRFLPTNFRAEDYLINKNFVKTTTAIDEEINKAKADEKGIGLESWENYRNEVRSKIELIKDTTEKRKLLIELEKWFFKQNPREVDRHKQNLFYEQVLSNGTKVWDIDGNPVTIFKNEVSR